MSTEKSMSTEEEKVRFETLRICLLADFQPNNVLETQLTINKLSVEDQKKLKDLRDTIMRNEYDATIFWRKDMDKDAEKGSWKCYCALAELTFVVS